MSPTIAGSRPGSLVAGAWAAMMSLGEEGFTILISLMLFSVHCFKWLIMLFHKLPPKHKQDIEASKRLEDGFVYYKSFFKLDGPCRFDSYRFVVRKPDMTIAAFGSKALDIL